MVKMKDIAKVTGYSITTVSKAFNGYKDISDDAKKIILKTADDMGYIPKANARSLATKRSLMIGIIFDEALGFGIRHPFFGAVIEFFKEEVEKDGYDIIFISKNIGKSNVKTYLDHCRLRGVDGVFIACANFDNPEIQQLINSNIPSVTVESFDNKIHSVNSDDFHGLYMGVEYLARLGHTKIAHIAGDATALAGQERKRGYLAGLKNEGIEAVEDYLVGGNMFSFDSGYKAMKVLLGLDNPPTAITTSGDMMALGAIKCIRDAGYHIPRDFSILGYDNIDMLEYMALGITTIAQNVSQMGKKAANILVQNIKVPGMNKKEIILDTKLVIRESCRDLNQA
ncbi:MAG: LacI family DNA-binding transcriptional regulator [Vallitaleaceae bacterium]|nr:LacI family DNA-binding transcriptional regulator [Vallitaleaceae bacterium]